MPEVASADVDVYPDPGKPALVLKGTKIERPKTSGPRGSTTSPVTSNPKSRNRPTPTFTRCRVDPENSIYGCRTARPTDPTDPEGPELTEGDILRAAREIGLPSLEVKIQPGEETLVNVATIFYTQPQPFQRSVDLLGFDVDLAATPVRYRWVHGDGTTRSTSRPGRPYPAMDVTHRYRQAADDVRARVDVTYRVRYRIDGGAWQGLGQTLVASGPVAELDVKEAAPVLTKP